MKCQFIQYINIILIVSNKSTGVYESGSPCMCLTTVFTTVRTHGSTQTLQNCVLHFLLL